MRWRFWINAILFCLFVISAILVLWLSRYSAFLDDELSLVNEELVAISNDEFVAIDTLVRDIDQEIEFAVALNKELAVQLISVLNYWKISEDESLDLRVSNMLALFELIEEKTGLQFNRRYDPRASDLYNLRFTLEMIRYYYQYHWVGCCSCFPSYYSRKMDEEYVVYASLGRQYKLLYNGKEIKFDYFQINPLDFEKGYLELRLLDYEALQAQNVYLKL